MERGFPLPLGCCLFSNYSWFSQQRNDPTIRDVAQHINTRRALPNRKQFRTCNSSLEITCLIQESTITLCPSWWKFEQNCKVHCSCHFCDACVATLFKWLLSSCCGALLNRSWLRVNWECCYVCIPFFLMVCVCCISKFPGNFLSPIETKSFLKLLWPLQQLMLELA